MENAHRMGHRQVWRSSGTVNLYSRRRNSFNRQYPLVYEALGDLPDNTVVDGEIVALDDQGKPNFNLLQHYVSQALHIHYFIFHLLVYQSHDLTRLPLIERREIMGTVLHFRSPRIRIAESFETSVEQMLQAVRELGLEGVVAKKRQSFYESGKRAGLLPKQEIDLCRPCPERFRACDEAAGVRSSSPARGAAVPVRQSPRSALVAMGGKD